MAFYLTSISSTGTPSLFENHEHGGDLNARFYKYRNFPIHHLQSLEPDHSRWGIPHPHTDYQSTTRILIFTHQTWRETDQTSAIGK